MQEIVCLSSYRGMFFWSRTEIALFILWFCAVFDRFWFFGNDGDRCRPVACWRDELMSKGNGAQSCTLIDMEDMWSHDFLTTVNWSVAIYLLYKSIVLTICSSWKYVFCGFVSGVTMLMAWYIKSTEQYYIQTLVMIAFLMISCYWSVDEFNSHMPRTYFITSYFSISRLLQFRSLNPPNDNLSSLKWNFLAQIFKMVMIIWPQVNGWWDVWALVAK